MKLRKKKDLASGVLFLGLGLLALFVAIPLGVQVPSTVKVRALSPDFWPLLISCGVILSAVFLIFEAYFMPAPATEDDDEADEAAQYQLATLPAALRTIILIFGLFAFYFSLTTLGVVAASVVLLCAMMLFYDERRYVLIIVLSICIPILLYLFFRHVASVPIPLGIFEF